MAFFGAHIQLRIISTLQTEIFDSQGPGSSFSSILFRFLSMLRFLFLKNWPPSSNNLGYLPLISASELFSEINGLSLQTNQLLLPTSTYLQPSQLFWSECSSTEAPPSLFPVQCSPMTKYRSPKDSCISPFCST